MEDRNLHLIQCLKFPFHNKKRRRKQQQQQQSPKRKKHWRNFCFKVKSIEGKPKQATQNEKEQSFQVTALRLWVTMANFKSGLKYWVLSSHFYFSFSPSCRAHPCNFIVPLMESELRFYWQFHDESHFTFHCPVSLAVHYLGCSAYKIMMHSASGPDCNTVLLQGSF